MQSGTRDQGGKPGRWTSGSWRRRSLTRPGRCSQPPMNASLLQGGQASIADARRPSARSISGLEKKVAGAFLHLRARLQACRTWSARGMAGRSARNLRFSGVRSSSTSKRSRSRDSSLSPSSVTRAPVSSANSIAALTSKGISSWASTGTKPSGSFPSGCWKGSSLRRNEGPLDWRNSTAYGLTSTIIRSGWSFRNRFSVFSDPSGSRWTVPTRQSRIVKKSGKRKGIPRKTLIQRLPRRRANGKEIWMIFGIPM